ncbi:HU family DNA-binding protein [Zeaxanthinibacter enoshimensis]|uniref:HU family DNA-binding protein n=1 Tax=Zeaxanthinibacter TaxID=561554 RepID=UPI003D368EBA
MARRSKFKHDIYREIVAENGGTIKETESIVESSLAFTRKTVEKGEFAQVRLPFFGKFHVNPYRLKKLNDAILQRGTVQGNSRSGD